MAADPYKYYRIEAQELLGHLHAGALALEKPSANAELVARLLRHAHTLKGAARVVKQLQMAEAAHAFEELLAPHRDLRAPWSPGKNDQLLALLDRMSALHAALDTPRAPQATNAPNSTKPQLAVKAAPALPEERARTLRADVQELDAVLDGLGEALGELSTVRSVLEEELQQLHKLGELSLRQLTAPRKQDARQLERVLSASKALSQEMLTALRKLEGRVTPGLDRAVRELGEARGVAERLRLMPAQTLFTALERAVRDVSHELGKPVRFEAHGGDIRLDGAVLEVVQSALFHVVRNAVTHGIEAESMREKLGKPRLGLVRLEVKRRAGRVAFVCTDDGGGLDSSAARAALQRRAEPSDAAQLDDAALLERLKQGGVSTAQNVSAVAGRGVGLDVLREAAARLDGQVALRSTPGRGFSVELEVPVSAAALMGLMVESAGTTAALPLESVVQCLRLPAGAVARGLDGESLLHDGKVIPFVPLSRSLRATESTGHTKTHSAVVVRAAQGERLALGVDRVLGTRMVVLRQLPPLATATAAVAGATSSAAGKPELVLDPDGLLSQAKAARPRPTPLTAANERVLVVDDSITTRMLEQSILESAGYQVDVAASGEEGLERLRKQPYALLLVDVEMPGIDGFTVIEQLRADPALSHIPAVLVSSRCEPQDLERGQAVGAAGYIVKSRFDQRELLTLIRGLLG
jgi:two-component system chemotaxis sensor kinase CheA